MKGALIPGGICLLSISFIVGFYLISVLPVQAAINSQIPFYGTLQDSSGNNLSGTYDMVFRFYDAASGGTLLDTSTHTATNSNAVTVTNGEFSVMLGSGTGNALDGLDFDTASIYVGLTVESDAEMTPRERLGAAPYAFNSDTVDGYDADQLLRYNATGSISATDSATLFAITQSGTGDIFNVFDGATEVFTILDGGNVGVGSTTPLHTFSVDGDIYASGALYDNNNSAGTSGYVLQSTGSGFNWVATSSLGISGAGTFLSLSDTQNSFTANRIPYTNSGATALTDSANFTFNGTNLGLGVSNGIAWNGTRYLYAYSTNDSVVFGENAGATFNSGTTNNVAIGFDAGRYASTSFSDNGVFIGTGAGWANTGQNNVSIGEAAGELNTGSFNNMLGRYAGDINAGSYVNIFGNSAGYNNSGDYNNIIGESAGYNNTGAVNNIIGQSTGYNNTGSYNNFLGSQAGTNNTGNYNELFGYNTGFYLRSTSSVALGAEALYGPGSAYTSLNNVAIGYRAGRVSATGSGNNILIGYQAADSLTTGANNIIIGYDIEAPSNTASNQLNIGNLLFGTGIDGTGTSLSSGRVGVGTTSPFAKFTVAGDIMVTGRLYDNAYSAGTSGMVLQSTGSGFAWVATSTLGLGGGGGGSLFTDGGATTYLTATGDNLGIGTTSANAKLTVSGSINIDNVTSALQFMGTRFLYASTTNDSLVFGEGAGATFNSLTTYNLAFGFGAGQYASTTLSDDNVFIGRLAGQNNTSFANVVIGYTAGQNNTGQSNVILGEEAGQNNTGDYGVLLGWRAGENNTGYGNLIFGEEAGQFNSGLNNSFIGWRAGHANTGDRNTILGFSSGLGNTGDNNLIYGDYAGNINTGDDNILLGVAAGEQNTGSDNFMVGQAAGDWNSGDYNNIFGQRAGVWNSGDFNSFIGYEAAGYLQSTSSVIIGSQAFRGSGPTPLIEFNGPSAYIALNNTALGYRAGYTATSGADNNIFVGYQAADNVTTGANNIVLGYDVDLQSPTQSNTLNVGNLLFGTGIDGTGTNISSGNIGIGTTSLAQKLTVAGDIRVGSSTGLGCIEDYDGTLIGGTCFSDESLKTNIAALTEYSQGSILENLVALTPVTYNWNTEAAQNLLKNQTVVNVGLIAQDVEESFPELIIQQGDIKQVRFASLQFYIIQAIKEMWEVVTGNQKRITELESRLEALEKQAGINSVNEPKPKSAGGSSDQIVSEEPDSSDADNQESTAEQESDDSSVTETDEPSSEDSVDDESLSETDGVTTDDAETEPSDSEVTVETNVNTSPESDEIPTE